MFGKKSMALLLTAIFFMFALSVFITARQATTATQPSGEVALQRLERYQRPTPLNAGIYWSNTIMYIRYTGAQTTADITVGSTNITGDAPGSTDDIHFGPAAGAQLGDSTGTGVVRVYDVCAKINAITGWSCALRKGADPFMPAKNLAAANNTSAITATGAAVTATAGKQRAFGEVIPAQGNYYPTYLHSLTASITGAQSCKVSIYDGTSLGGSTVIWYRTLATTVSSTNEFPGGGLAGSANTAFTIRGVCSGYTVTAGFAAIQADTHGY
jgi:hypothetical protein